MIDPARPEVKDAVHTCRTAGIRPVMITGDHPLTARYIASELGIAKQDSHVITGVELEQMTDSALEEAVKDVSIFARVSPEHKLRIVTAFQNNGHIAAMTGDGVNDAPALKKADIGVAMGITGTDVAKGTADMVLTDDNYASIVAAVEQGRVIYSNIRKFVFFLISCNIAEIMIIFLATIAGLPMPLTVIQLLWLNLLTDGAPALALAMEKGDPDVMLVPPRPKEESIINNEMRNSLISRVIFQTAAVLGAFLLGLYWHLDEAIPAGQNALGYILRHDWRGVDVTHAVTMAFVGLSLVELFRANTVRSERTPLHKLGFFSNTYMQGAVIVSVVLLLLVVNVPFLQPIFNTTFLTFREWMVAVGLALIPSVVEEVRKILVYRKHHA
ncbi:MAG: Calcium-transporting ATPase 1 [Chloroflexi bacterium ADurb.Bin360]|nr:MAG: Calcium-transporting ATPase 1 [Chloroflexi bacterium ADurb.Bin360]